MNKLAYLLLLITVMMACSNETNKNKDDIDSIDEPEQVKKIKKDINHPEIDEIPSLRKCYTYKDNEVEAEMNLELEDELVTGELNFKGQNPRSGTVTGEFVGDTLVVAFKYKEKDKSQVEEIIFLEDKKQFTLQMGSAETVEKQGIKSIESKSSAKFDGFVFEKFDCEQ